MFLKLFRQLLCLKAIQSAAQISDSSNSRGAANGDQADAVSTRNAWLSQQLLILVHDTVSRAMFSKDHLSLALHLARHLLRDQFPDHGWAVLLSCSSAAVSSSSTAAAAEGTRSLPAAPGTAAVPPWLGSDRAAAYEQIAASFPELVTAARLHDSRIWAPWAASAATRGVAGATGVPVAVSSALTVLQQLILVAAFQPERWVRTAGSLLMLCCLCDGGPRTLTSCNIYNGAQK
jgi:hypothetical protein